MNKAAPTMQTAELLLNNGFATQSKRSTRGMAVALAIGLVLSYPVHAPRAEALSLPGTYKLLNTSVKYLDTGEVIPDIFGKTAVGYIMYGTDGRMMTLITYEGRPKPESISKTTDEQRLGLYKTMQAYGGTYTFDGKTVKHNVDICWDAVRCGTVVERDVERDGGDLVYKTHPAPFSANGRMAVTTLRWRRVE